MSQATESYLDDIDEIFVRNRTKHGKSLFAFLRDLKSAADFGNHHAKLVISQYEQMTQDKFNNVSDVCDALLDDADIMMDHYVASCCWVNEEQIDVNRDGFDDDVVSFKKEALQHCRSFIIASCPLLLEDADGLDMEQLGHDFYLSRNGHGTGFFDREFYTHKDKLQSLARDFGETYDEL